MNIRPVTHLCEVARGMIVRHKLDADSYVVIGNVGGFPVAVRETTIAHPDEWEIVSPEPSVLAAIPDGRARK